MGEGAMGERVREKGGREKEGEGEGEGEGSEVKVSREEVLCSFSQ